MTTAERLAAALDKAGLTGLASKARQFAYDDYKSPSATPINDLVADLAAIAKSPLVTNATALSANELIARAVAGEFDGTKEEADAWAASPEGREAFREFGLDDMRR